ncbi:class I SAM-dependent DNA methyltransferase [Tessaracoccus coleopterorum]|uniref:class I SAM-dependent DNA methyltransferase n=1 Tax=Tessaracoccus coleopterorum TaxID=2714950 RepID=UPI001E503E47|nr:class I SAM-dependent methyltransferase [Tessaracoccus coleopterorum]
MGDLPRPAGPVAEVDREEVLASGTAERDALVRETYAAVADAYQEELATRLDERPLERWLLDRVVELAWERPIADVGSGTGASTAYLARRGGDVTGYDFSPEMVEVARRAHPDLRFETADQRRLLRPPAASGWGAITAWYSMVHYAPSEVAQQVAYLANLLDEEGCSRWPCTRGSLRDDRGVARTRGVHALGAARPGARASHRRVGRPGRDRDLRRDR